MSSYSEFILDGGITIGSPRFNKEDISSNRYIFEEDQHYKLNETVFMERYPGYTYCDNDKDDITDQKRTFYYDGVEISKDDIPENSFLYMKYVKLGYEKTWKNCIKYRKYNNKYFNLGNEIPEYTYLLNLLGIKSRKDWETILLENRRIKNVNVNIDILLFGMVNNAIEMRFT